MFVSVSYENFGVVHLNRHLLKMPTMLTFNWRCEKYIGPGGSGFGVGQKWPFSRGYLSGSAGTVAQSDPWGVPAVGSTPQHKTPPISFVPKRVSNIREFRVRNTKQK